MTKTVPVLVDLPRPRALTEAERGLVHRLAAFAPAANLSEQVTAAFVVSTCACGCGSVGLRSEGPPVPAAVVARLSVTGRDDYFAVSASGDPNVSVVLHIIGGMLGELEIFAGEGVKLAASEVGHVHDLWIG